MHASNNDLRLEFSFPCISIFLLVLFFWGFLYGSLITPWMRIRGRRRRRRMITATMSNILCSLQMWNGGCRWRLLSCVTTPALDAPASRPQDGWINGVQLTAQSAESAPNAKGIATFYQLLLALFFVSPHSTFPYSRNVPDLTRSWPLISPTW